MRAKDFITEANRNSIILVDFQPEYDNKHAPGYRPALQSAINYINKRHPQVTAFFNGEDVAYDDVHDVMEHYVEYGLDKRLLGNINFTEKTYGFFREWMDDPKTETATIIRTVRYMVMNGLNDSRDIPEEIFAELTGEDPDQTQQFPIYLPEINIGALKALSGSMLGGGGKHQCLSEIQILMNAFNIKYKLVNDWIYV